MRINTMKEGIQLIVFSDDWNGLPFSCKHLIKCFIPDQKIIWVDTIGIRSPRINKYDLRRGINKIVGWFSKPKDDQENLTEDIHHIDPFQIPFNQFDSIRKINKMLMLKSIRSAKIIDKKRPLVLLTTWPFMGNLIGELNENLSIYYRVDDFSEFPGVNKEAIKRQEEEIIAKSGMVLATSEELGKINKKKVKYLPHGVDFNHFASFNHTRNNAIPNSNSKAPKIGFFGLINTWIDFELIELIADKRPEWSFIFIGPSQIADHMLPKKRNILFRGPISYDDLPKNASQFDIAIIPFKLNKLTVSVNPLKLLEYFALGLPVISTPLPEVAKYKDLIQIASCPESFEKKIADALVTDSLEKRNERIELSKLNSWSQRADTLKKWIENYMQ